VTFLVLGAFVAVVGLLAWYSHRRGQRPTSCCAPPDPRHDLRMRAAFEDGPPDDRAGE
jgi:hypothetical protein